MLSTPDDDDDWLDCDNTMVLSLPLAAMTRTFHDFNRETYMLFYEAEEEKPLAKLSNSMSNISLNGFKSDQ